VIEGSQIPDWLRTKVTNLIPENENTERPKITDLQHACPQYTKTITPIICKLLQNYVDKNLMPREQEGCSRESKACKDQLQI
jgi:hypothetical protein